MTSDKWAVDSSTPQEQANWRVLGRAGCQRVRMLSPAEAAIHLLGGGAPATPRVPGRRPKSDRTTTARHPFFANGAVVPFDFGDAPGAPEQLASICTSSIIKMQTVVINHTGAEPIRPQVLRSP